MSCTSAYNLILCASLHLQIQFTLIQFILIISLLLNLGLTLVIVPLLKFNVGRLFGAYLVVFYVLFMVFVVITEAGLLGDPEGVMTF